MRISLRDPRTGQIDGAIVAADANAVRTVAARLRAAQPAWANAPIESRANALLAFRDAVLAQRDALADALERDTGRRASAKQEISDVASLLATWAEQAPHLIEQGWTQMRSFPALKHKPHFIPYPLIGVISPWNYPLTLPMIDAIPALLAGCAILMKPSEVTPRFLEPLRSIMAAVPTLNAVFATLEGDGTTGQAMIDAVDAVCFTGSVETGKRVAMQCASRLIPAFLELGGKDPMIVLENADIDDAVTAALRGSVLATGQACQSIERIYVQRPIFDEFVQKLTIAAKDTRLNWPDIDKGDLGPVIFDRQAQNLHAQLSDAMNKGARILTGGNLERHGGGLWMRPTVIINVNHGMTIMTEETLGPIMPVMPFDHVDDAIRLANDGPYGLSAAVFAGTLDEAERIARRLDVGAVCLNDAGLTAFIHETEKQTFGASGLGVGRMGAAGFHRFLRRKALIANTDKPAPLSHFAEDAS